MTRKRLIIILAGCIAVTGIIAPFLLRFGTGTKRSDDRQAITLLIEVLAAVQQRYVDAVEPKKLIEGAVNGMLASLDPHSAYLPPVHYQEMQVETSGTFGGLGIEINIRNDKLTVVTPIEGTPAAKAGILPGDHITRIDNASTDKMTIFDAVKRMRGPKGTSVTLLIAREGTSTPFRVPLVRDIIQMQSTRSRTLEPGYGYVRISQFQAPTAVDFRAALEKLRQANGGTLKGLIIDLRNNPGGLVDSAVMVADRFIGEGASNGLVVYTKGRTPSTNDEINARIGEKEPRYPIVVLINGGSASASEIVAGALQDHRRAVIMGTQSFGKGSIQTVYPLRNGSALKLTIARYYTPNGRSIQARGITPDIVVPQREMPASAPKEKSHLREKDLDNHLTPPDQGKQPPAKPAAPKKTPTAPPLSNVAPEAAKDYQLHRAMELLKGLALIK